MKIIRNIPMVIEFVMALPELRQHKKNIYKYRELGDLEKEREYILKATSTWGKRLVRDLNIDLNIIGKENLPDNGPVVFVGNHQGYGDIPIYCAALDKFQTGFIAKDSLEKVPLYGEWIKNIRSVLLPRENPRESLKAMETAVDLIKQGFSMVIFPEGHRSKCEEMGEFKKGSLRLATKPGVPVVPISVNGTYKLFEESGYMKKNFKIDFMVHPPIETSSLSKQEASNLAETVEEIVRNGLEELKKL